MRKYFLILLILYTGCCFSQYAPAAGQPGSTAIAWDSSAIVGWATNSITEPGYMDISQPSLGLAATGDSLSACGAPGQNGVFSLGDGGSLTLTFDHPIINEQGYDFALFENSFMDTFLEFGFVEVSSNGERYVRFPSVCLTDSSIQLDAFGLSNPEKIHNLAGKYRAMFGTPFDLQDIADSAGVDLMNINYVRVRDVIGCISQPQWTSRDAQGRVINDPWPTPFPSSGIDIDALGIIHWNNPAGVTENNLQTEACIYPNPVRSGQGFRFHKKVKKNTLKFYNLSGNIIELQESENGFMAPERAGIYFIEGLTKPVKLLVTE